MSSSTSGARVRDRWKRNLGDTRVLQEMSSPENEIINVRVYRKIVGKTLKIENISELKPSEKISFDIAVNSNVYVLNIGIHHNVNSPLMYFSIENQECNVKRNIDFRLTMKDNAGHLFYQKNEIIKPNSPLMILTKFTIRDLPAGNLTIHYELSCISWTKENISQKKTTVPFSRVENLSRDFGRLYSQRTNADITMHVGTSVIPVHSQILSARSEVFAAMFEHDMSEKINKSIRIPDINALAMHYFLTFVYTGKLEMMEDLRLDTLKQLYIAADKYAVAELKEMISNFLMSDLSLDNVATCAELAFTYCDRRMQGAVIEFISKRTAILDTRQWRELEETAPSVAAEVVTIMCTTRGQYNQ